ncbi:MULTISPECIES: hypothetical protein [unclassified Streptomyces]|uniref:hypothetical protein n=1 Tax=unclassified Streptomyces TaxID=2593676 RepID=UPI0005A5F780|nr:MULTISPECIES: hypothetical protein [unclassified Streptomyces]ODA72717.1 hypothetical protein APS67_003016 [Streptomyces sp. AVP053U2]
MTGPRTPVTPGARRANASTAGTPVLLGPVLGLLVHPAFRLLAAGTAAGPVLVLCAVTAPRGR